MGHLIIIIITILLTGIFIYNKKINIFWFLPALFLGLAVGMQDNVGTDYLSYVDIYNIVQNLSFSEASFIEPGFYITMKILHFF